MISLALEKCKEIGLKRGMITCDSNNIGSKKSIINNGGVYESNFNNEERHWIELEPYNRLEGDKIVLRKGKISDLDNMLNNVWSNPTVYNTMLYTPITTNEEAMERLVKSINFQNENYGYFVALKETDEPIGMCAIKEIAPGVYHECGMGIAGKYHGLGFGKEILSLLLDLVFNKLNGNEFQYGLCKNNDKSRRLLRPYGFVAIEPSTMHRAWDNQDFEIDEFSLSKEAYFSKNINM